MANWKKVENEKGFLYYINDEIQAKQWDQPKFSEVKQAVDDCNYVAYSAYRLALKFRVLQRCLYLEEVSVSTIITTFESHKLGQNENSLTLEPHDLEDLLSDIFFSANKKNHTNIDIDLATELFINFLYNVFDIKREGKIQVFSTKILLGILCSSSTIELYKYLFSLCADHNNCLTQMRLHGILEKLRAIIKYFHEDAFYGLLPMHSAIEKCFQHSPGLIGITEHDFLRWLDTDVPFLAWMPLISKLKSAETVIHASKCSTCKSKPMLGLKYRCLKCPNYTQCQRCFLTGRVSHSHKFSHSLREYSVVSTNKGNKSTFIRKMCGLFCSSTAGSNSTIVRPSRQFANEKLKPYLSTDPLCDIEPLSSPDAQLQGVIRQLESQNRELQQMLIFGNYNDKDLRRYLEDYRLFMANNIRKLKFLKNQIINLPPDPDEHPAQPYDSASPAHVQSTPMMPYDKINSRMNLDQGSVSPVVASTEAESSFCNDFYQDSGNHKEYFDYQNPLTKSDVLETVNHKKPTVKLLHTDLDDALAKLQQILANNFSLEDSLNTMTDNTNLKDAVNEVEGMLNSIIDNVEYSRCNSALPGTIMF